jgi:hypothetical protein
MLTKLSQMLLSLPPALLNYCNMVVAFLGSSIAWFMDLSSNASVWIEVCVGLVLLSWAFFNAALGIAKIIRAKKGKQEGTDGPRLPTRKSK